MKDNDPRHGSEAGNTAHFRAGTPTCDPCKKAKNRADKLRRYYGGALVPLTQRAWDVVNNNDIRLLMRSTGVSECALRNILSRGESVRVKPATLRRILTAAPVTDIGIIRRARALATLGWSTREIADVAGVHFSAIERLWYHSGDRYYIRSAVRDGVVLAFNELAMRTPSWTRWSSRIINRSKVAGWASPLAWDDMDDPTERPKGTTGRDVLPQGSIDHALIELVITGSTKPRKLTTEEAAECVRRLKARGLSTHQIERDYGFNTERYKEAAA